MGTNHLGTINTTVHSVLSVKAFLAKYSILMLDHPLYSPDVAPCDFYIVPTVKSKLKGTRFESVESVKQKAADTFNKLTEEGFQHCFAHWKIRIEQCGIANGSILKTIMM